MVYTVGMAIDKEKLNKYEKRLCNELSDIMKREEVKFSRFLPLLVKEVPEKSSEEYFKILKKQQMKLRRGSLSLQEVHDILDVMGWEFKLLLNGTPIKLKKYSLEFRIRFADLIGIAELMGMEVKFAKKADRTKV